VAAFGLASALRCSEDDSDHEVLAMTIEFLISALVMTWAGMQDPPTDTPVDAPPAPLQPAEPPVSQPPPSAPPDGIILSGPTAEHIGPQRPTITRRSFEGALEEINPEPEIEALDQLAVAEDESIRLTDEQKTRYERIRLERAVQFDKLVRENYAALSQFGAAVGSGERQRIFALLGRLRESFKPYTDRGTALDEMRPHLTEQQVQQVEMMLNEYMLVRLGEMKRSVPGNPTDDALRLRARLELFGQAVRASVERQVALERAFFDDLAIQLELTPEQTSQIEAIVGPLFVQRFQGNIDSAERAKAFAQIRTILRPAQRQKLVQIVIESWKPSEP
jgi:hypothetical protein